MRPRRIYSSGSRWAFWRWNVAPSGYITRLHVVQTPMFAICCHWIDNPDPEPYPHDHPVSFVSVMLRGWYWEERWKPRHHKSKVMISRYCRRRWGNFIRGRFSDAHRIIAVAPGGAVTLCFMTRKLRDWGFHTDKSIDLRDDHGWIYWRDHNNAKYKEATPNATQTR